ncbi:hypothetical protein LTR37_018569 [Vermiconidia calcicola]|uniref:Uncharacterized protein n=1 Tax=Vermiconidia calcicola TaxID=1690605 RepID=A0ACC3MI06_9PEZI|nr:hypothetical protein LTR37_018569 [Vermiconidia calcicola]
MPHKHTRRKGDDASFYDLAPTTVAKPLPAYEKPSKDPKAKPKQPKVARPQTRDQSKGYKHDDTPRAFARMMQSRTSNKRPRTALDDGNETRKAKQKRRKIELAANISGGNIAQNEQPGPRAPAPPKPDIPKILPGERLVDFATRVNHALPVGGLERKGKGAPLPGMKERQTKTEKRLKKMYASWREEEARLREKEEERREQAEEAEEEKEAEYGGQNVRLPDGDGRRRKKQKVIGEQAGDDDDDPWAQLKAKRDAPKGLHDVVQAPPTFKVKPKEKFKVRNGARVDVENIPTAAGSLKRREELSGARKEVIERYRSMMGKGKGG